jgi:DNA repair protein RadC
LHEGHRKRFKERFIKEGLSNFEPHQVLELLLFFAIPRIDTNPLAHKLIDHFGSIINVLDADVEELKSIDGLGENASTLISFVSQLSLYYATNKHDKKEALDSSAKACSYVKDLFLTKKYECFFVVCLDNQNRVNMAKKLFEGTTNETPIYPRILVEYALRYTATGIIIAHNHPGGSLTPSSADMQATKDIKNALHTIGVKLLDHIIVADNKTVSFAEQGWL